MDELINNINLGRFSRAIVNIAPSINIKMKANNIFAIYRNLIPGFETFFVGCVPPDLCESVNKIHLATKGRARKKMSNIPRQCKKLHNLYANTRLKVKEQKFSTC